MHDLFGKILVGLIFVGWIYVIFSNFGVRGWTKNNKLWWRE